MNNLSGFVLALAVMSSGCANFYLENCPEDGVLGHDEARIRSWRIRSLLEDEGAAANRFADYAAMSAYAYVDPKDLDCGDPKFSEQEEHDLTHWLDKAGWKREPAAELGAFAAPAAGYVPGCEDNIGFFYHAWKRDTGDKTEVVFAFRGTQGLKDWWYGNAYWFRRWFTDKHQYEVAREFAGRAKQYFKDAQIATGKSLEFSTTGHSLGGGLAQGVLYDQLSTDTFKQAYAFAPSSATAYTSRRDKSPFANCVCNGNDPEPRIFRIYESYEVLANLRFFHKLAFPPEPWINEVRFNFADTSQHSMLNLALAMITKARTYRERTERDETRWYAAPEEKCTVKFRNSQIKACPQNTCATSDRVYNTSAREVL